MTTPKEERLWAALDDVLDCLEETHTVNIHDEGDEHDPDTCFYCAAIIAGHKALELS